MRKPARNPFHHPDNPAGSSRADAPGGRSDSGSLGAGDTARVEQVERVDKPWGHEEIFAVLEGRYVGKVLTIGAGRALSLQHHRNKDETLAVQTGEIRVEYGPDRTHLTSVTLAPGERLLIRAYVIHRITAIKDSCVLEASTARPGWRDDVVRLDDHYGREGTSAP